MRRAWRGDQKGHKDIFRGDGDVHYPNCGDDFKGVYICPNLSNCAFFLAAQHGMWGLSSLMRD